MKLALFTAGYLFPFLRDMVEKIQYKCEIDVYNYQNFQTIGTLYQELECQYDGFLVSGGAAYRALLKKAGSVGKPVGNFDMSIHSLNALLLKLLYQDRSLDFSRVILDIVLPYSPEYTCADLMKEEQLDCESSVLEEFWRIAPLEELECAEAEVERKIIGLWNKGKLDLVICRFSSILPRLEAAGVPCLFVYPNERQIRTALDGLVKDVEMSSTRENMPSVIAISLKNTNMLDEMDLAPVLLQKHLLEFNRQYMTEFLIQKATNGFEIFTSLRTVRRITEDFRRSLLSDSIASATGLSIQVGYGIGSDILEARQNAALATREATDGLPYLVNEEGVLIGPLTGEGALIVDRAVSDAVQAAAYASGLSTLTIQKIRSILKRNESNELTSHDLMNTLNVKIRNANRILGSLTESGYATVVNNRAMSTKGRPVKVYQVNLPPES